MNSDLAIRAIGLAKSYGTVPVLAGADLAAERGTVFALLGPNGAGKTTTVRILATLASADAGQAWVAGHDVAAQRHLVRRAISLTGQHTAVDAGQTGEENLRMMGRLSGLSRSRARRRARDLLEQFGLADAARRRTGTYSGGMRRRLDLAAGLVAGPEVIFLDEPTTGLDVRGRQAMYAVVADLARSGVTIFLTTQYLEEADRLADRVAVLDGGRVVAAGPPAELKRQAAGQRLELTLADPAAFAAVSRRLADQILAADPATLAISLPTDGAAAQVRALLDEIDPARSAVRQFAVRAASLDDVFLALTGHAAAPSRTETADV